MAQALTYLDLELYGIPNLKNKLIFLWDVGIIWETLFGNIEFNNVLQFKLSTDDEFIYFHIGMSFIYWSELISFCYQLISF